MGKRRLNSGTFKKGHKILPPHLNAAEQTNSSSCSHLSQNQAQNSSKPVLRSQKSLQKKDDSEPQGNRVINLDKQIAMMNKVYEEHSAQKCDKLNIKLHCEQKLGLGSRLQFKCLSCQFVSSKMETFNKCPGSQAAAINMLVASALQDTAIGIEKVNLLFTSMDIPAPSRSYMQNLTNTASLNTVQLNNADMTEKRKLVVQHNKSLHKPNPNHLDLSFDGRYNAARMVSSYKPGQAASQAYGVAIENHTSYNYIIGLAVQNKLCWTGAYMRNKGFDVNCPGHFDCTATMQYMQPHSERKMAYDIAEQLSKEDILVRTLTTDGDTKAHLGMTDFYDKLGNAWKVARQADPYHLGSRQVRKARASNWSPTMFEGKTLSGSARQQAIRAFAKDIKARCSAIIEKLRLKKNGLEGNLHTLPTIRIATLECYAGSCKFCPEESLVCSGVGNVGDWWYNSSYLPTHGIHHLELTRNDRELLSAILEIRLCEYAIKSVTSNTSTQKCESFNRSVLSTLPKEINFSRNFAGSLASKTLQINNSLQVSVEKKVRSITGHSLSPRPLRYLISASKRLQRHRH
jgi:hypothetical protein